MSQWRCRPPLETAMQRHTLWIALWLNAAMFAGEVGAGIIAHSTALVADGLDMFSDAVAYSIALVSIGRSQRYKANAARLSGWLLLLLGVGVIVEVGRRLVSGEAPQGTWMIAVATIALIVNTIVYRMLSKQRHDEGEIELRAAWLFTWVDVIANAAVILSGLGILLTGFRQLDLIVGAGIGIYIVFEAIEILKEARRVRQAS